MGWVLPGFAGYFFVAAYLYSDVNNFRFPDEPEITEESGPGKALRLVHLMIRLVAGLAFLFVGVQSIL